MTESSISRRETNSLPPLSLFRPLLRSAYNEVIDDLWHYLRDEKGMAEPQQYLCVPMRSVGLSRTLFADTCCGSCGLLINLVRLSDRYIGSATEETGNGRNGDGGGAGLSDVNETSQTSFGNGDEEEGVEEESGADKILVLQDLFAAGYHAATQDRLDENGLDFNHR